MLLLVSLSQIKFLRIGMGCLPYSYTTKCLKILSFQSFIMPEFSFKSIFIHIILLILLVSSKATLSGISSRTVFTVIPSVFHYFMVKKKKFSKLILKTFIIKVYQADWYSHIMIFKDTFQQVSFLDYNWTLTDLY